MRAHGRVPRLAAALLLLVAAAPARADEGIARRLAVLHFLAEPGRGAALEPPPTETRGAGPPGCAALRSWRATEYGVRSRIDGAIRDASLRFGVSARLIRSVIRHESAYDPNAVSHKGAMGLMQLMPRTADQLGVVCPFDPRENVLAGARYLRRLRDRLGSWPRAVAAYHAGPARVESGSLPEETRRYVRAVLASWRPGSAVTFAE